MKKDAYYFPHFSNARHDRKIKRITKELGVEGYGIYFMILEVLREQTDLKYPVQDIDLLADEFRTSEQKVRIVITNYDLFTIDEDEMFFSPKQNEYLQPYFKSSERARDAANKRWEKQKQLPEKCDGNANAMQMQSDGNASKVKKSKEEKSKVKDSKEGIYISPEKFYEQEIANNKEATLIALYEQAANYILSQTILPKVEQQMSYKDFATCYNKAKTYGYKLSDYLKKMENWKDGNKDVSKKNKTIHQTLLNWMQNDAQRSGKI